MDICTHIKFKNKGLNIAYGFDKEIEDIHAHFIIEDNRIFCKIYEIRGKSIFSNRIGDWIVENSNFNLFDYVEIVRINSKDKITKIHLQYSKEIGFKGSTNQYENGKYYILIEMDQLIYEYAKEENEPNNIAELFLNDKAIKLVKNYYSFLSFIIEKNKWKASTRWKQFIKIDKYFVKLKFDFETDFDQNYSKINYLPLIEIKHDCIEFDEFEIFKNFLQRITSFFCNTKVDVVYARIYLKDRKIVIRKKQNENLKLASTGLFGLGYHKGYKEFLKEINFKYVNRYPDRIIKIIDKYIFLEYLEGEAKFMICYSILENIRNLLLEDYSIKEEYEFLFNKKKTSKHIAKKLKELAEIVVPEEKEIFTSRAYNHVRTIKLLPMYDQLEGLFKQANISLPFDLRAIIKVRNSIFHGSVPKLSLKELNEMNFNFEIFIGKLILNILGIK